MPKRKTLEIHGDLLLDAPGGGRIHLVSDDYLLEVNCSDDRALRDVIQSFRSVFPGIRSAFKLMRTPNPLNTTIVLNSANRKLVTWPPGKRPQLRSIWQLLKAVI